MSKWVRAVVMWLVVLAIPLQGVAATLMPLCLVDADPAGVAGLVAQHAAAGHAGHVAPAPGSAHAADHEHHGASTFLDASDLDQTDLDLAAGHAGHGVITCCSVASSMAAVFPPSFASGLLARSPAPVALQEQVDKGIVLDGLERPPRPLLA